MPRFSFAPCAAAAVLLGCHSYAPLPVDLVSHAEDFAARRPSLPVAADGLTRLQGRACAKLFHPDARLARRRAGIAEAERDQAGRFVDPRFNASADRILETVPHRWLAAASIGFTLPINGRLHKEKALFQRRYDESLWQAWATEQRVANDLDRAWSAWSAQVMRAELFDLLCDRLTELETTAKKLVAAGSLTKPGARVFELERVQREAERALAHAERDARALEVKQQLGLHPEAPIALQAELDVATFFPTPEQRQRRIADGPSVLALRLAHHSAEAALDLEIRRQWPDLVIRPGWNEEDAQPRATLGLQIPLPLLNGNEPAIARAMAERETTAAALRAELEQSVQRLAVAERRRAAASEQRQRLEAQLLPLTEQQIADSKRLALAGQFDPLLVLDGVLRAHDVRIGIVAMTEAIANATVDINQLLTDPDGGAPDAGSGETP